MLIPAEHNLCVRGEISQLETFDLGPGKVGSIKIGAEEPGIV